MRTVLEVTQACKAIMGW